MVKCTLLYSGQNVLLSLMDCENNSSALDPYFMCKSTAVGFSLFRQIDRLRLSSTDNEVLMNPIIAVKECQGLFGKFAFYCSFLLDS